MMPRMDGPFEEKLIQTLPRVGYRLGPAGHQERMHAD
jgi:DNA-binding winged helix-turn-helix (wHTH) protein